jgi:predicted nuclease with TOPRIM domain
MSTNDESKGKTPEQLQATIDTLRQENTRLRTERDALTVEMEKHIKRFSELRDSFASLRADVDLLVKRTQS